MKKYWDHIEIGDSLHSDLRAPITRLQIARFAAASDDFSPLNLDDESARDAGYHTAYAPGLMSLGFVEESLRHFAKNMKILTLSGTFQRLIWPGDRLKTRGLVLRRYKKDEEYRVYFTVWCENQNNEVVMKGTSTCLLFKNADHESRSKIPFPQISVASIDRLKKKCNPLLTASVKNDVQESVGQKEFA